MYYIIENGKITDSSESYLFSKHGATIEKSFTQEELEKINARYSYNIETSEFEETEESREFEAKQKEEKKKEILQKLGELKQIKDGLELVGENTEEMENSIEELKQQYNLI